MKKISSESTFFVKKILPVLWLGVPIGFGLWAILVEDFNEIALWLSFPRAPAQ